MSNRAADLAGRFRAFNDELNGFVGSCTDEDWSKVCPGEQWPVGVVVRHIAASHIGAIGLVKMVVAGEKLPELTAGVIDQMHVMHARGAGRHASEARQTAVDMFHHVAGRRLVMFKHLLDEVDAPAWRIELVAQQHVGRARGDAESAMHASAQDFLRRCNLRVEQLCERERRLHG